ncbi:MAG TPA: septum formation initiator family protein [Candidatus Rifleibacterium sp.]|nr:septum formation initiator family protein [Candidatus Rifleibacterium sp.]HPT45257.1 septum formation initiator family protein [Candidatus Rifleibacterium sp.]
MSEEKAPAKRKRVRFSTEIMFILSVVFCVALSITYLVRYNNIRTLLQREVELRERIEDLERENRHLKSSLEMLSTPEGIERLARERLGLVKPEELVVYTINEKNEPVQPPVLQASDTVEVPGELQR